jgi:hypothetical protein
MDSRNVSVGIIERTDVKIDYRTAHVFALPRQRGSTLTAEPSFHARRGLVDFAVPFCELDPISLEHDKGDDRRAGVPTTAVAMTVPDHQRPPNGLIAHLSAHAPAGYRPGFLDHDDLPAFLKSRGAM